MMGGSSYGWGCLIGMGDGHGLLGFGYIFLGIITLFWYRHSCHGRFTMISGDQSVWE